MYSEDASIEEYAWEQADALYDKKQEEEVMTSKYMLSRVDELLLRADAIDTSDDGVVAECRVLLRLVEDSRVRLPWRAPDAIISVVGETIARIEQTRAYFHGLDEWVSQCEKDETQSATHKLHD